MSHIINHSTYEEKVNKKAVQQHWDEVAAHEDWQEGCTGLDGDIKWYDTVCEDYDKAKAFLDARDYSYAQIAVKYKEWPVVSNAKLKEIEQQLSDARDRSYKLKERIHYQGVQSNFIACKHCQSKINSEFFGKTVYNSCPVCRKDLRPQSTLDTIENAEKKVQSICEKYRLEQEKESRKLKPTIKWLVKTEYHV